MTFACERCGASVEVAVRRMHRFCASCKQQRVIEKKRSDYARLRSVRVHIHETSNWAELEVAGVLGLEPPGRERTHCQGCGKQLPVRQRKGGPSRRWCSEGCRMRIARRGCSGAGSGYFGALLSDPCVYCGALGKLTVDHIDASSAGGSDEWANLVGACQECNSQKRKTPLLRYLLARPLYAQITEAKAALRLVA
jgi:hypothetical protein